MQILKCLDEETRKYRGEQTELSARPWSRLRAVKTKTDEWRDLRMYSLLFSLFLF
jgi:hypothetical protein